MSGGVGIGGAGRGGVVSIGGLGSGIIFGEVLFAWKMGSLVGMEGVGGGKDRLEGGEY